MEDCHTHPNRFEIRTIFFSLPTNVIALPGLINTAKEKMHEYYFVELSPIRNVKAQHLNPLAPELFFLNFSTSCI